MNDMTFVNVMLDADAVINNSSQKVGGYGPRKTHRIYVPAHTHRRTAPLTSTRTQLAVAVV